MNPQMINSVLFCQRHRIIQILCIFTVNCYRTKYRKIQTTIPVGFLHMIRHTHCLIDHLYRKFRWNLIAFDNSQNICSRCINASEIFFNTAFRLMRSIPVIYDLGNYLVTVADPFAVLG